MPTACEVDAAAAQADEWAKVNEAKREIQDDFDSGDTSGGPRLPRGSHRARFARTRGGWVVRRLDYVNLQRTARIFVRCRGAACPLRQSRVMRPRGTRLSLAWLLRGRALPAGTRLFVTIDAPGRLRETDYFVFRKHRRPVWGIVGA